MKSIITIVCGSMILFLFTCCTSVNYYQVSKITPIESMSNDSIFLVYEDDNCKISYNFWSTSGGTGFIFYNKTDLNIYIDKEQCFYVMNGHAQNYYKSRSYTESENRVASVSSPYSAVKTINSINNTVTVFEDKIICIPPHTFKAIEEYYILDEPLRNCDLIRFPRKDIPSINKFTQENSPLVFKNIITYKVGSEANFLQIENNFYISEIGNYQENDLMKFEFTEYCGEKSNYAHKVFKASSPDMFYLKYVKSSESYVH